MYTVVYCTLLITDEPVQQQESWCYIGRYRSHSRPVSGLEFGVLEDGTLALFSIGEDRCMVKTYIYIYIYIHIILYIYTLHIILYYFNLALSIS
jgi:hypothetical protein